MTEPGSSPFVLDVQTPDFASAVVERSFTTPVMVDFWATWCAPCRALGPILERLAVEYAGGFVLAKIDTDQAQAVAAQYQVRSIPSIMLFRHGKVVSSFQGALPEGQIRQFLTKQGVVSKDAGLVFTSDDPQERVTFLRSAVVEHPTRDALRVDLAVAVLNTGDVDEAARLLESLPAAVYQDGQALRARARIALLRRVAASSGDEPTDPGIRAVLAGDFEVGLAQLLEVMRDQKHDAESPARTALVEALQLMDDEEAVRAWRRRMAAVLF